jgi:hypothetical protein
MAGSYCLAILAGFCFHSSSVDAQLQDIGLGYALTVKTASYEASTSQTDVIRFYDWRQQPIACADKNCVRYHKSCAAQAAGVVCNYQIAFLGEASSGAIRVSAASERDMAAAQEEISLWFGSGTAMLPLSALSKPGPELAVCPAGTDPESCNPQTR